MTVEQSGRVGSTTTESKILARRAGERGMFPGVARYYLGMRATVIRPC